VADRVLQEQVLGDVPVGLVAARSAQMVVHQEMHVPLGLGEEYWTDLQLRQLQQNVIRAQAAVVQFADEVSQDLFVAARFAFLDRVGRMLWRRHDVARHRGMHAQAGYNWRADALFERESYFQAIALARAADSRADHAVELRDAYERRYFLRLAYFSKVIRRLLPEFLSTMVDAVPDLSDWGCVAVAFGAIEVGCVGALESARWLWLVRLVQGAAPYFCPATLAALALLAANCQQLPGLVACWAGVTGEPFHFTAALNADVVSRAVAWLYLRPVLGVVADRARLLELTLDYPDRLNPRCLAVSRRAPHIAEDDLLPIPVDCDFLGDGGAYIFAPLVPPRARLRVDPAATMPGPPPFPPNSWHRSFDEIVPAAVPWVLGFVAVCPPVLSWYNLRDGWVGRGASSDTEADDDY